MKRPLAIPKKTKSILEECPDKLNGVTFMDHSMAIHGLSESSLKLLRSNSMFV